MEFVLSMALSGILTAGYTCLVLYRGQTFRKRFVHSVLRFCLAAFCFVTAYVISILAVGAVYLVFDWYSGSDTATVVQFWSLTLFSIVVSVFIATRRFS